MKEKAPKPTTAHLYGIDPGSRKPWIGFYAKVNLATQKITSGPTFRSWSRYQLNDLLREIDEETNEVSVTLVSLDVPLSMPSDLIPDYISEKSFWYPFDVEPFTTRPCEAALRKRPQIIDKNLQCFELVSAIGRLCDWSNPFNSKGNIPFQNMTACEGISVMIYSEAPHQPITRVFLAEALKRLGHDRLVQRPVGPDEWKPSNIYIMESHPAVSMGFWAIDGAFDDDLKAIERYKGKLNGKRYEGMDTAAKNSLLKKQFGELVKGIDSLASRLYDIHFDSNQSCDDRLDSFIGLLNLLDLVNGKGDWFGTAESGYFLTPQLTLLEGQRFSDLWAAAEASLLTSMRKDV